MVSIVGTLLPCLFHVQHPEAYGRVCWCQPTSFILQNLSITGYSSGGGKNILLFLVFLQFENLLFLQTWQLKPPPNATGSVKCFFKPYKVKALSEGICVDMTSVQGTETNQNFWRSNYGTIIAGERAGSTGSNGQKSRGKELCRQRFLNGKAHHWVLKRNRSGQVPQVEYLLHSSAQGRAGHEHVHYKYF